MLQDIKDEILSGDPRYAIRDSSGNVLNDKVDISLKTPITQEGTPVNRALFRNLQGDLYTQDRYNILDIQRRVVPVDYVTDIIISQNVNVEDCIPKIWVADDDTNLRFTAEDGTKLYTTSTSTYNASTYANMACDGDVSTYWSAPSNSTNDGIILKFTKPIIITKMKTYIGLSSYYESSSYYIKGSNDGINWTTILTNTVQQSLTSIELPTKAPYQYYQFSVGATGSRKN